MTHSQQKTLGPVETPAPVEEKADPPGMGRVATASFIGTVIEFYDFGIYGTAAALVFPEVFFPALGQAAGVTASFAALGVAFVARPFGSLLFGHFGDRLGRKKTLIATMLLMGVSTILVGCMPTADQIGVVAPILIVVLRVLQGLAAGGEFAGAVLFSSEHAPKGKRGFWAMFPNFGGGAAITLANLTFLLTTLFMSDDTFISWGWRIPFLASFLLVLVGLWIRLRIDETPVFKNQVARSGTSKLPFLEALKHQPRQVLLASGTVMIGFALTYIGGTYLVSYGTTVLDLPRTFVLSMAMVGGLAISAGVVLGAVLSDRIGRRWVIVGAAGVAVVWALALFPLLDLGSRGMFAIGVPVTLFLSGIATGPQGAFLSELFHTRYRYTAAGLSYSLAGMIGGGVPPLIAPSLIDSFGSFFFGCVLAGVCLISLICVLAVGETRQLDLDRATADPAA
ncbi:MFS transporter [Streptomyces sp. BpilaLS-43]|uniref:MFS transporter n=1 Tax=unclassified Streptomyces TaxID=2593676 RepID=UPI00081B036C|nr:MFS transporter [Streptomyces sp. BpilaLS-43]SCD80547.1 Predicted arabinose efflux permease, MFS family [Streptomyces sp. BpilaLS-43]